MADHKSSKKRIIRNNKRNEINSTRISKIRTFIKKVEKEISSDNKVKASDAFKVAMPEIQKGVSKGLIHKNTAARKLSRLSAKIKNIKNAGSYKLSGTSPIQNAKKRQVL